MTFTIQDIVDAVNKLDLETAEDLQRLFYLVHYRAKIDLLDFVQMVRPPESEGKESNKPQ